MPVKYWRQPSGAADGLWIQLNWWQSKKKGFSSESKLGFEQVIYFSWKKIGNGKGIINFLTIRMRVTIDMIQPPVLIWLLRIIRINMTVLNLETSSICIEWSLSSTLLEFLTPGDNIITFFFTATKHFNVQIQIQNYPPRLAHPLNIVKRLNCLPWWNYHSLMIILKINSYPSKLSTNIYFYLGVDNDGESSRKVWNRCVDQMLRKSWLTKMFTFFTVIWRARNKVTETNLSSICPTECWHFPAISNSPGNLNNSIVLDLPISYDVSLVEDSFVYQTITFMWDWHWRGTCI